MVTLTLTLKPNQVGEGDLIAEQSVRAHLVRVRARVRVRVRVRVWVRVRVRARVRVRVKARVSL